MQYQWDKEEEGRKDLQARRERLTEAKLGAERDEMIANMDEIDRKRLRHERKYRANKKPTPWRMAVNPCGLGG